MFLQCAKAGAVPWSFASGRPAPPWQAASIAHARPGARLPVAEQILTVWSYALPMGSLKAVLRKLVPGFFTAAAAVGVATLSVSVVDGHLLWFGLGAALRVGLPAFVAGLLFFPVAEKTLASRTGFALRAGFATLCSSIVHRALWTANAASDDPLKVGVDFSTLGDVFRHPLWLWPTAPIDTTAWLAAAAIAGATTVGLLAQPTLKRVARSRRPSTASALAQLDSSRARPAMVRTR